MFIAERSVRAIVFLVVALALLGFAAIQLASDSLYAGAATRGAFPTRVSAGYGLAIYRLLDRIAPAPYVESTLAREALLRGDTASAERYALRLPPDPVRNGLLANIAAARGRDVLAYEYAFAAPDIDGVQTTIARISARQPEVAYRLEERFRDRLISLQTHPDAVAHAWWMLGDIAASMPGAWQMRAYGDFVRAAQLAPLDVQNILAVANQAVTLQHWNDAERWYRRSLEVNPANADAIAGLGIVALEGRHDRTAAIDRLHAARAIDPSSRIVTTLERELLAPR